MAFKDIKLKLYCGEERQFSCVTAEIHDDHKMLFIHDGNGERVFFCHLEDLIYTDECLTTEEDPIRKAVMDVVKAERAKGSSGVIPGIKKHRELTGEGLRESKHQVDEWIAEAKNRGEVK